MATYADAFAALVPSTGGAWLPELKRAAFDRFTALGFPTTRNEDWHYTSVTPIAEKAFRPMGSGKRPNNQNRPESTAHRNTLPQQGLLTKSALLQAVAQRRGRVSPPLRLQDKVLSRHLVLFLFVES